MPVSKPYDEWERIGEENSKFQDWWDSEMASKFEDHFTRTIAENVALMAWHAALGLDFGRAMRGERDRLLARIEESRHAG